MKPGGIVLFSDPVVVTGGVSSEEIRQRIAPGFYLFFPRGENESLLEEAGFRQVCVENGSENVETYGNRWVAARARYEAELREIEGDEEFEKWQNLFRISASLATQEKLSRLVYIAKKPSK